MTDINTLGYKAGRGWGQWLPAMGKKQNNPSVVNAICYRDQVWPLMWVQREGREYGIAAATSMSEFCRALGSQELGIWNLWHSCGPPAAVLVHLVVALLLGVMGKHAKVTLCTYHMPKNCFPMFGWPPPHPHARSSKLVSHLRVCVSFCKHYNTETVILKPLHPISEDPFVLQVEKQASQEHLLFFYLIFTVIDFHLYAFLFALQNVFPLLCFLSSPSNKSVLTSCFLNAAEAFFT